MNKDIKLLFIAATHGNEGFSIPSLRKLEIEYPKIDWNYDWIIGNPKALEQDKRFTEVDLNRSAPGDSNSQLYEERRAAELIEIASEFDLIVDIHGTVSPCGMVKIIPLPTLENLVMALLFPELANIIWYSARSLKKGPLTQFTNKPSLEIECGMGEPDIAEKLFQVLAQALLIKQETKFLSLLATLSEQEWYQVVGQAESYDLQARELQPLTIDREILYPFLTNQYREIPYYLLKKIMIEEAFLNS